MAEEKNNKSEVEKVILGLLTAISHKDIKTMMSYYASDVIVFDCKPPFQTRGAVAWRHTWEASLPYFPETFKMETRGLAIHANEGIAIAHYLFRMTSPDKDHPAMKTWMRITTALKFQQGKWKIIHEHGSVPFQPNTGQALFTLDVE